MREALGCVTGCQAPSVNPTTKTFMVSIN